MGVLAERAYLQASGVTLATDLARYGTTAQWRGMYYRGEKVGFTVGQTVPTGEGFELQEDGRLQMSLLGATTPAVIKTSARVDRAFALQSFDFSLDPGTGPLQLSGTVDGLTLTLRITSAGRTRTEVRTLTEPPALMLNLARRLANGGLRAGARHELRVFDPATLSNAPVVIEVSGREVVVAGGRPIPAFKVQLGFSGLTTTAWITDTGEIVREESPLGLMSVRETPEQAQALAVSSRARSDMLQSAAIVPTLMQGRDRAHRRDAPEGRVQRRGPGGVRPRQQHPDLRRPRARGTRPARARGRAGRSRPGPLPACRDCSLKATTPR